MWRIIFITLGVFIMRKGALFFLLVVLCSHAFAQAPVLNSNPGSVRWDQVITPSFKIIFPSGYDQQALRIANTLEHLKNAEAETMSDSPPKRIPIILNQYQSISNAFVTMGPWRSEFNLMPSPRPELLGTNTWDNLIAAHEYRHVVQFHHSRRGINRFLYYIFGQQTQAGMAFAAVPRWFWEGDATLTETLYSRSGRGRIPAFGRVFKTNLLEEKRYDYNKQHLGSYKDFVPDHYKLGYYFVTHIRRRTNDPEIWEDITGEAFSKSLIPFTFSNSMKKYTGMHLVPNYEVMMDELSQTWRDEQAGVIFDDSQDVNRRKETTYTDYLYPQQLDDGRVVALMSGLGDFAQFVTFDNQGFARKLFIPGIVNDAGMLSARGTKIVYNEFNFDPRWRNRTYSVLKLYDISTGRIKTLSKGSRYIGADLAPDGRKVVTSESATDQSSSLVVLDALTGARLNKLQNLAGGLYLMPRWSDSGDEIVAVKLDDSGKKLIVYDYLRNTENTLWDAGDENIAHPVPLDSVILYNSPRTGTDNIFAVSRTSGLHYQITNSRYGAYNPEVSADGQWLIYNEHRLNGMDVVRKRLLPELWLQVKDSVSQPEMYFEPLLAQEGFDLMDSIPQKDFPVQKYSKAGHMFNIHSWGPLASTDLNSIEVGVASRDVLSTTQLRAGYIYDLAEETGDIYAELSYQGLYPILDFGVELGNRRSNRGSFDDGRDLVFDWKETTFYGGVRLPFILTRSKMLSELILSDRVGYTRVSEFNNPSSPPRLDDSVFVQRLVPLLRSPRDSLALFFEDELADGNLISNNLSVTYYALLKQSERDINSRYGLVFNARWLATPFGGDFNAHTYAARATVYMPSPLQLTGIAAFKHHSLFVTGAWQSSETKLTSDLYVFRNQIPRPRGYSYALYPDFQYLGVNYTLPVWYPDIALGPVLFIKRLRANLFYDYGEGSNQIYFYDYKNNVGLVTPERTDIFRSAGIEASLDLHVMRFPQEFGIGVRYSRLLTTGENTFNILLNIDF